MESPHENIDCVYLSASQEFRKGGKGDGRRAGSDLTPTREAKPETLATYDLVGFGSGIYFGKHHRKLLQFVETLPPVTQKQAFVFSTRGDGKMHHEAQKKIWSTGDLRLWMNSAAGDGIRSAP
jgi:flavodoxin